MKKINNAELRKQDIAKKREQLIVAINAYNRLKEKGSTDEKLKESEKIYKGFYQEMVALTEIDLMATIFEEIQENELANGQTREQLAVKRILEVATFKVESLTSKEESGQKMVRFSDKKSVLWFSFDTMAELELVPRLLKNGKSIKWYLYRLLNSVSINVGIEVKADPAEIKQLENQYVSFNQDEVLKAKTLTGSMNELKKLLSELLEELTGQRYQLMSEHAKFFILAVTIGDQKNKRTLKMVTEKQAYNMLVSTMNGLVLNRKYRFKWETMERHAEKQAEKALKEKEEQAKKENEEKANDEKLVEEFDFDEIMDDLVIPEVA